MPYVHVDIDWNDISTWELLEELEGRNLDEDQQRQLSVLVCDQDKRKWELFMQVKNRFTLQELEELFKENLSVTVIPKNQLALNL